jgi:hypothetical protein
VFDDETAIAAGIELSEILTRSPCKLRLESGVPARNSAFVVFGPGFRSVCHSTLDPGHRIAQDPPA